MLVVGFGIGMVMQVLVLAVQNSVDRPHMGVATADSMLFRQIGGSIGDRAVRRDLRQPARRRTWPTGAGVSCRRAATPETVRHLPPAIHDDVRARGRRSSLQPVFVVGAVVGVAAFLLTWLLREMPLRHSTGAGETAGETFGLEEAA